MDGTEVLPEELRRAWDCQAAERPESVPWPDYIGCPWVPWGRNGQWFVFEEPQPPSSRAARRVYLSAAQIRNGEIEALQIRHDLLESWFPDGYGGTGVAWGVVATWLIHHIAIAEQTRVERYRRMVANWDRQHGANQPQAEPVTLTWSTDRRISHIRSLHIAPHGQDAASVAVTVAIPGQDAAGFKVFLSPDQVRQLRAALPAAQP